MLIVRPVCYKVSMTGDLEQLGEHIAELAAHLDAAMHRLLTDLREFDARGGWHAQGAMSCAHWLAWRVGWDPVTARERVRVARKLADFPAIDDALRRGELSYSKVRALLRMATPANEAMILEHARLMTASQLEKLSRKYAMVQRHGQDPGPRDDEQRRYVRRRDTDDGMVKIEAVLHPEEAELVWTMLDHAAKHLTRAPGRDLAASHDSAESPAATVVHAGVAGTWPGTGRAVVTSGSVVQSSDDSAESPATTDTTAAVAGTLLGTGSAPAAVTSESVAWSSNDSAESPEAADACTAETGTLPGAGPAMAVTPEGAGWSDSDSAASCGPAEPSTVRTPSVLHQQADAARRAFSRADALISVAQAYLRGDRPNRTPIDVTLTIPASSLRKGAVDTVDVGCMGDSCVSATTARRLTCDAGVAEVIEDEHGVPLSVGRKRRTIAGSLKRALMKRDTTCSYPGCENRTFLDGHHIEHWADGGETTLDNASLLCTHHHRYVHEYGYSIELGAGRRPRFRDPIGRLVEAVPARHGGPELGWPQICEANQPLAIDADTIACEWDGSQVDYGMVVDQLVVVDGLA
jgi:hypothetical protein